MNWIALIPYAIAIAIVLFCFFCAWIGSKSGRGTPLHEGILALIGVWWIVAFPTSIVAMIWGADHRFFWSALVVGIVFLVCGSASRQSEGT